MKSSLSFETDAKISAINSVFGGNGRYSFAPHLIDSAARSSSVPIPHEITGVEILFILGIQENF